MVTRAPDGALTKPRVGVRKSWALRQDRTLRPWLFYIENWSVLLDLALLSRTIGGVIGRAWRLGRSGGGR